ncbi:MAG: hypothetical protein JST42_04455 [Bacteroidetes bacterium]|nr:hypothetical protein [Bacteroidota bacterium]
MENIDMLKSRWNDRDFDTMGWHDCQIYAIAFDRDRFELIFDIDYLVEWKKPAADHASLKFWVVPATLVFKNVHSIEIGSDTVDLVILNIVREALGKPVNGDHINASFEYQWIIETTSGEIRLKSIGYEQFARKKPVLMKDQAMGLETRNGISFDKMAYQP